MRQVNISIRRFILFLGLGCLLAAAAEVGIVAASDHDPRESGQTIAAASWRGEVREVEREGLRILVTNDDGIEAPGLHALVKELARLGEVVVSAPLENKSGISHASTFLSQPLRVTERPIDGASASYAVDGTPADAVNFGVIHLGRERRFDLVVSGINAGANIGEVAHLSGTVGAALEGVMLGLPAVAVSQGSRGQDFALSAAFAARFIEAMTERGWRTRTAYSINVPSSSPASIKGVTVARMGGSSFRVDRYQEVTDQATGEVRFRAVAAAPGEPPADSDTAAFRAGHITITPLRFDWTDQEAIEPLRQINLSRLFPATQDSP